MAALARARLVVKHTTACGTTHRSRRYTRISATPPLAHVGSHTISGLRARLRRSSSNRHLKALKCRTISRIARFINIENYQKPPPPTLNVRALYVIVAPFDVQRDEGGKLCCEAVPNAIPMLSKALLHVPGEVCIL